MPSNPKSDGASSLARITMVNNCVACWPPWEAKFHFTPDLADAFRPSSIPKRVALLSLFILDSIFALTTYAAKLGKSSGSPCPVSPVNHVLVRADMLDSLPIGPLAPQFSVLVGGHAPPFANSAIRSQFSSRPLRILFCCLVRATVPLRQARNRRKFRLATGADPPSQMRCELTIGYTQNRGCMLSLHLILTESRASTRPRR